MRYWELRTELQGVFINGKEDRERYKEKYQETARIVQKKQCQIEDIDQGYAGLSDDVRVQRELIQSIMESQSKDQQEER